MKFAKVLGLPRPIVGLILYVPPLHDALVQSFGEAGRLTGAVLFASGWALLPGYLAFNFGMLTQKKRSK